MGKRITWFEIESPKQRKKKEEKYFKQMFPLGLEQRTAEAELIKHFVRSVKADEALYHLLQVKEIFLEEAEEEEAAGHLEEWMGGHLAKGLSQDEKTAIIALARHSRDYRSMDEFPSKADAEIWVTEETGRIGECGL